MERIHYENATYVAGCRNDCNGKRDDQRLPLVATAPAAHSAGFAAAAAATAGPGSGKIMVISRKGEVTECP